MRWGGGQTTRPVHYCNEFYFDFFFLIQIGGGQKRGKTVLLLKKQSLSRLFLSNGAFASGFAVYLVIPSVDFESH